MNLEELQKFILSNPTEALALKEKFERSLLNSKRIKASKERAPKAPSRLVSKSLLFKEQLSPQIFSKNEIFEEKSAFYKDILSSAPALKNAAQEYIKPEKPLTKSQLKHCALLSELEAQAKEIVYNLARLSYTSNGTLKALSPLERALSKELREYENSPTSIQLPILYPKKPDHKIKELKNLESLRSYEEELTSLDALIENLSAQEYAAFAKVAEEFIKKLLI